VANGEWALVVEDHTAGSTGTVNVLWTEMTSRWD
jgi:subtilisin-like proprotein convertase family protein